MAGATTTLVRADARPVPENQGELHPQLKAQLRELRLRTGSADPDVPMLLRLINEHYQTIERERRGIVESMRLMADEAQALAHEAREQSSEHLQVILDHIKDVVLLVDAEGLIRTFNPTGERVFGYAEREVLDQRIDFLIPKIADDESIVESLERLATSVDDTARDLAARELWAQRHNGGLFPAEIAVSKAPVSQGQMFVLCLRDVTERRESEQAMRESAARYQLLVDHAPDAIVVLDADTGRFVDANDKAIKLFGLGREKLLTVGPHIMSPALQPDGATSEQRARAYIERALAGEVQVFEWTHRVAGGRDIVCEVRLVNLPSGSRRLVRGSIADISERKRAERVSAVERQVFEQLTRNAPLAEVLASITALIESAIPGTAGSVSLLDEQGKNFTSVLAPQLPAEPCAHRSSAPRSASATARARRASTSAARCWWRTWARILSGPSSASRRWRPASAPPGQPRSRRPTAVSSVPSGCTARRWACRLRPTPASWRVPRSWPASPSSGAAARRRCAAVKRSSVACSRASPKGSTRAAVTGACCR